MQIRRQRMAELGALYHRVSGVDMNRCAYCAHPRQCLDHVPPLVLADIMDIDRFRKDGGVLMLVPSCFECNARLGAKPLPTFDQRLAALHEIYGRLIRPAHWSSDELEGLGRGLRSFVANKQRRNKEWISKLRGIEDLLLGTRPRPTPFRGAEDSAKIAPEPFERSSELFSGPRRVA